MVCGCRRPIISVAILGREMGTWTRGSKVARWHVLGEGVPIDGHLDDRAELLQLGRVEGILRLMDGFLVRKELFCVFLCLNKT